MCELDANRNEKPFAYSGGSGSQDNARCDVAGEVGCNVRLQ